MSDTTYSDDPKAFESKLLDTIRNFAPSIWERVSPSEFGLTRPVDIIKGRLTPVVRRGSAEIANRKFAIAVGDAWILNDPIAAQGANLGSRCAFVLGDAIASGGPYDEGFCRGVEESLWAAARAPTMLSNALLEPPPPNVVELLGRASVDQETADKFANGFGEPEAFLGMLAGQPAQTSA